MGRIEKVRLEVLCANWNSSATPMVWARAVSLTRVINSLLMGGSTFLTTWGSTMRKKVWVRDRPSTLAASRCPKGTLSMPPR